MNYGLSIPLDGVSLYDHHRIYDAAVEAGFTDLWSSEVNGADAFSPLVAAGTRHPHLRLGTAIVPAYTRSPALLAMSIASLADSIDGEALVGVGTSSNVIVQNWNGIPFVDPYQRVRDVMTFLRRALAGEKVDMDCDSFSIKGFRLGRLPRREPKLLVAALRPGMLRLAGRLSDGAILNWLSPEDVRRVVEVVREAHPGGAPEIVARLFVIPSDDIDMVRATAKRSIAAYLNVPVYAEFHRWLGRTAVLQPMWDAWKAGDRQLALELIPDHLVDELFIHGTVEDCQRRIDEYVAAGITTPALAINLLDGDPVDTIKRFARPVN